MKRIFKDSQAMVEQAEVVFEETAGGLFKAIKTRYEDGVITGGIYSRRFIEAYARENIDVYIIQGGKSE